MKKTALVAMITLALASFALAEDTGTVYLVCTDGSIMLDGSNPIPNVDTTLKIDLDRMLVDGATPIRVLRDDYLFASDHQLPTGRNPATGFTWGELNERYGDVSAGRAFTTVIASSLS